MRRREVPAVGGEWPARLQRFVSDEWAPYVGRQPVWWGNNGDPMSWPYFKARRLWGQARNNWRTAAGETWWGGKPEGRARARAELAAVGLVFPTDPAPGVH